jgi:hypothetical protein
LHRLEAEHPALRHVDGKGVTEAAEARAEVGVKLGTEMREMGAEVREARAAVRIVLGAELEESA